MRFLIKFLYSTKFYKRCLAPTPWMCRGALSKTTIRFTSSSICSVQFWPYRCKCFRGTPLLPLKCSVDRGRAGGGDGEAPSKNQGERRFLLSGYVQVIDGEWPIASKGLLKTVLSGCQLDLALQGQFHRQISAPVYEAKREGEFPEAPAFEKIILSSSSSSVWGDCYAKLAGNAYIFGQVSKSPINIRQLHLESSFTSPSMCFRCITLIAHTSNVLQSIHQDEEICHESVESAEKSCFLASQIPSPVDGKLLFRSEFYDSSSCHLDGLYSVGYKLKDFGTSSTFECAMHSGSQMNNCEQRSSLKFSFHNCSFPDFDQTLVCLGTWPVGRQSNANSPTENYLSVLNLATQEYKCGLMQQWNNGTTQIYLSADSSCFGLLKDGSNALEEFSLVQEKSHLQRSQCEFPSHLRGEYGDRRLTINSNQIQDKQNRGSSVVSVCVSLNEKSMGERILVHSTTSCGASLGYHCLWFRPRSESVLEFKTTPTVSQPSQTMCSNDREFEQVPWTTLVSNRPQKSLCGFFGQYSTPREMWLSGDCYSLSVDCELLNSFKLVAFHCQTGEAYDAKTYQCFGTWKEDELMFVYTQTDSLSTSDTKKAESFCFISQQHNGNLFVAPVGSHCERDFNFTANSDRTIILNQQHNYSEEALFFVEKEKRFYRTYEKQVIKNKSTLADDFKIPRATIQKIISEKNSIVKAIEDGSGKKRAQLKR